jgi:hypothetical protein
MAIRASWRRLSQGVRSCIATAGRDATAPAAPLGELGRKARREERPRAQALPDDLLAQIASARGEELAIPVLRLHAYLSEERKECVCREEALGRAEPALAR